LIYIVFWFITEKFESCVTYTPVFQTGRNTGYKLSGAADSKYDCMSWSWSWSVSSLSQMLARKEGRTCCRVQMLGGGAALLVRVLWWWQARDYATTGSPTRGAFTYQLDTNARVQPAVGTFELEPVSAFPENRSTCFFVCVCVLRCAPGNVPCVCARCSPVLTCSIWVYVYLSCY